MRNRTPAPCEVFQVRDLEMLQAWSRRLWTTVLPHRLPRVRFELSMFPDEVNESISALANGWRDACGCASGGFFMTISVVSSIWFYFSSGGRFTDLSLQHVGVLVGVFVLATAVGKALGLIWARFRLLQQARRLTSKLRRMRNGRRRWS